MTAGSPYEAPGHPSDGGSRRGCGSGAHPQEGEPSAGKPPRGRDHSEASLVVTRDVTQACALACGHCRAEANPERSEDELNLAEAWRLFEQMAESSSQPVFVLSDGDPLKRPDLFELLEAAVDADTTPATTDLPDGETLERFEESGIGWRRVQTARRPSATVGSAARTRPTRQWSGQPRLPAAGRGPGPRVPGQSSASGRTGSTPPATRSAHSKPATTPPFSDRSGY